MLFRRLLPFLQENPSLALFALLATASSGFGQTFLLGLFGDQLRNAFGLSHSLYGLTYSLATLCSAALLLRFGSLLDHWSLRRVTLMAILVLSAGCLMLGLAGYLWMLALGFLLVRFGGQAMLSHIGMTTAGRYFSLNRGKVVAFSASGFPLSEAVLPLLISALVVAVGWRGSWIASAVILLIVLLPLMLWLSRNASHPQASGDHAEHTLTGWTRAEVLRDRGFYLLLPASIAVPFIVTALFFHQGAITTLRGWSLEDFARAFISYGAGHFLSLFLAGVLIDRVGAQKLLPVALIPLLSGLLVLGLSGADWIPWLFLGLLGLSQGAMNATLGALWPERYGVRHIGAIRSVMQAIMVLSTAVAPVALGLLLDAGVGIAGLVALLAVYTAASAALAATAARASA
ncbi:MFS transporter [Halopseudomonas salina]|uniref:MFS transporter n=1 Tax=Halopseudomonas salina TaxID=1323744 RepID=A0ABQ1PN72_9GAMM|nr:MFS transporter [Halopseudomonas salina]GGC99949.1 MFS transporter [Halopseudomonas salina]